MKSSKNPSSPHTNPKEAAVKHPKDSSIPESKSKISNSNAPQNMFSNDGSFLEKFKAMKKAEEEKRKAGEAVHKKKELEDRIKNRGKRKNGSSVENDNKKLKENTERDSQSSAVSAYLKEMEKYKQEDVGKDGWGGTKLVK